jgi:hypothetical protein
MVIEKVLGYGIGSVEFIVRDENGGFQVNAFEDGGIVMKTLSECEEVEPTDEIRKAAKKLLRNAKKPSTFKGRAMSGPGVDR